MEGLCPKCGKPGEFCPSRAECKTCRREIHRAWRQSGSVKAQAYRIRKRKDINPVYHAVRLVRLNERRRTNPIAREKEIARNQRSQLKRFGLTQNALDVMVLQQNNACAICFQLETRKKLGRTKRLAIDHDHFTKLVRGLLCHLCNTGLGSFYDTAALLRAAADYLERDPLKKPPPGVSARWKDDLVWWRKQRVYGLNKEQYAVLLQDQLGRCAICVKPETMLRGGVVQTLSIDHNHRTGALRGLLCGTCNTGLGNFHDSPALLRAAAQYLDDHNAKQAVRNAQPSLFGMNLLPF